MSKEISLLSRLRNEAAGAVALGVVTVLWGGLVLILYRGLVMPLLWPRDTQLLQRLVAGVLGLGHMPERPPLLPPPTAEQQVLALLVLMLCVLPYVLTCCVALALLQRGASRTRYRFIPGTLPAEGSVWEEVLERILMDWDFEMLRMDEGLKRVLPYGAVYGFLSSATLGATALLLSGHLHEVSKQPRYAMALSVAAAAATSFAVNFGRLLMRVAHRDASPRMFAWGTRGQLLSSAGAILLVALMQLSNEPMVQSAYGFIVLGMVVALFGERSLQVITDRAAQVLGLPRLSTTKVAELQQLAGLSEEDVARLAEEGVDSIHALAFMPTARLYFNTTYSLHRICQWQDQALLLCFAEAKSALFREQLMISGAQGAQVLAEQLLHVEHGEEGVCQRVVAAMSAEDRDSMTKLLGFGTATQARVALAALAEDPVVRRLRVYWRGGVRRLDE